MDFAPEDLALATVPGMDFDPKQRAFNLEELRPQPIIRKRKKNAVPEEMKDERYWDKRTKNKMATRRSREARRLKENQIALRAAFLEKENAVMKKVCCPCVSFAKGLFMNNIMQVRGGGGLRNNKR